METNGKATGQPLATDDLVRLCERKDRFIAIAGHELRNQLAPIVTTLDVLVLSSADETHTELLRLAAERARQLSRLINDLFDVTRLATGQFQLRRETIDTRNIVDQIVKAFTHVLQERRQELLVTPCDVPLWLNADPLRLEQVFLNLLNNAIKFTPENGCIWLQLRREDDAAVFHVRDSGCGIRPEILPTIFNLFSRDDNGDGRATGGLGIGLAMVKSIVEMHGGTVLAHSDGPGCGADFKVRLPLIRR